MVKMAFSKAIGFLAAFTFLACCSIAAQAGVSQDSNGWTVFTPTPVTSGDCAIGTANGTCVIYVSNGGDDSTCVLANVGDTSHPCATITKGIALLRFSLPDWLLLRKGDSWVGGYFFNSSGFSASAPMVISSYDPANPSVPNPSTGGARPRLIVPTTGSNSSTPGIEITGNVGGDFLAFVGLEFYASDRDPNNSTVSPVFNAATIDSNLQGFTTADTFNWFLIEDCKFSFFNGDVLITPNSNPGTPVAGTFTFNRNLVLDAYGIVTGTNAESGGMMIGRVTTPIFTENVFDHNGWNESLASTCCTVFTHNLYGEGFNPSADEGGTSDPATLSIFKPFQGNIVARDGGSGSQFRSGGTIDNNLFLLNPVAHNMGAPTAAGPNLITNNVYLEALVNSAVPIGGGPQTGGTGCIGNLDNYCVGTITISDNVVANARSVGSGIAVGTGFVGTIVKNNIIFNWGPNGTEVQNFSGGSIIDTGNTKDALGANSGGLNEPFSNPYQLNPVGNSSNTGTNGVDGYYAHIGNPGGFPSTSIGFLSAVRQQSKANWNPALMASAVNDYVRKGFSAATSTPPTVTINSPQNGAIIKGNGVNIVVTASDVSDAIVSITIAADTQVLLTCKDTTSCSTTWQTKKVKSGTQVISASATDAEGLTSNASVTVTLLRK
jgi:hypothetical protein